jgi:hypothetical protein
MRLGKYLEADDSACSPPSVPLNQSGMSFVTPAPGPSDLEIILDFGDLIRRRNTKGAGRK